MVAIDFGDGQRGIMTAEDLRKNKLVMHPYADAKSVTIAAIAAEAFKPDAAGPKSSWRGQAATVLDFAFSHFGGAPTRRYLLQCALRPRTSQAATQA